MFVEKIKRIKKLFIKEETAATAVEYAVLLMLIAGACITAIQLFGGSVAGFWDSNVEQVEKVLNK